MLKRRNESSFVREAMSLIRYGLLSEAGDNFMVGLLSGISRGSANAAECIQKNLARNNEDPDAKVRAAMTERERELHDKIATIKKRRTERMLELELLDMEGNERVQIQDYEEQLERVREEAQDSARDSALSKAKLMGRSSDKLQSMIEEADNVEEVIAALGVGMTEFEQFCEEVEIDWKFWLSQRRNRRRKAVGLR